MLLLLCPDILNGFLELLQLINMAQREVLIDDHMLTLAIILCLLLRAAELTLVVTEVVGTVRVQLVLDFGLGWRLLDHVFLLGTLMLVCVWIASDASG